MSEKAESKDQEQPPSKDEIKRELLREIARAIQGAGQKGKDDDSGQSEQKDGEKKEGNEKDSGEKPKGNNDKEQKKKKFKWTPAKVVGLVALVLVIVAAGAMYLSYSTSHATTDDAYTTGYVHQISSRVSGNVTVLNVVDNQHVVAGQILVQLDPRDYQVQVAKAQSDYDKAKADFDRVYVLKDNVAISKQDYDQTKNNLEDSKAALDDARDQLSYCTIVAPTDGYIGNRTVNLGNRVTVGGELMAVVQDVWVVANYKETQLGKMKKNQRVKIKVDAIPGHNFWGHVDSFSPGTGAVFSLLPPDNATGNFTKIVQRVPVKVLFERDSIKDFQGRLVPGLSVETYVTLDKSARPTGDQSNKSGE